MMEKSDRHSLDDHDDHPDGDLEILYTVLMGKDDPQPPTIKACDDKLYQTDRSHELQ